MIPIIAFLTFLTLAFVMMRARAAIPDVQSTSMMYLTFALCIKEDVLVL